MWFHGSVLPTFNKKLISNSLNILYDKLNSCPTKGLVSEISAYLMIAVYKMFRLLYNAGPKNASKICSAFAKVFTPVIRLQPCMRLKPTWSHSLSGEDIGTGSSVKDTSAFSMTTEKLSKEYPCTPPACST